MRIPLLSRSLLAVAVSAGVIASLTAGSPAGDPARRREVHEAATSALRVHTAVLVPGVHTGGGPPSEADLQRQLDDGLRSIRSIFTNRGAEREAAGLANAVNSQRASAQALRMLASGIVEPVDFHRVTAHGDTAEVAATVEVYLRWEHRGSDGMWRTIEPHNTLDVRMELIRINHTWMVDLLEWRLASGVAGIQPRPGHKISG